MAELSNIELRISALESRIVNLRGIGDSDPLSGDGATHCNGTNACTNCVANELMNVLLPGQVRPLSGRELVAALQKAQG